MPRRKKQVIVSAAAAAEAQLSQPDGRPGITSLICLKDELQGLYKGESPLACMCPLCSPASWCAAVLPNCGICLHPRAKKGDARLYPFCATHYQKYVDCWPTPEAAQLEGLRAWAALQTGEQDDCASGIALHPSAKIYEARLALTRGEAGQESPGAKQTSLGRIMGALKAEGVR